MSIVAMAMPILPGKLEEWRRFSGELMGARHGAYEASRRRLGVREHSFLQHTPMGDLLIIVWEGENPMAAMAALAASRDPFDQWSAEKAKELHGVDPSQAASMAVPEPGPSVS